MIYSLQGPVRRIVYVAAYELIALILTTGYMMAMGQDLGASALASAVVSITAVFWNLVFNWLFERWEARQTRRGRSIGRRILHALGFEGGLALMIVPFFALWFGISLWEALVLEAGVLVFFLIYTYVFAWVFDRLFGLPESAQPHPNTGSVPSEDPTEPPQ
ncbi:PACE efflux transporter [Gulosibacter hominis]|uniref:PACE efflux transporter n=1 Tax=Gulosibacter hominis TaxID=2770504 RepID=UPI00191A5B19|nr:PACE efflux transporter [Gulosibacter hominis]